MIQPWTPQPPDDLPAILASLDRSAQQADAAELAPWEPLMRTDAAAPSLVALMEAQPGRVLAAVGLLDGTTLVAHGELDAARRALPRTPDTAWPVLFWRPTHYVSLIEANGEELFPVVDISERTCEAGAARALAEYAELAEIYMRLAAAALAHRDGRATCSTCGRPA